MGLAPTVTKFEKPNASPITVKRYPARVVLKQDGDIIVIPVDMLVGILFAMGQEAASNEQP